MSGEADQINCGQNVSTSLRYSMLWSVVTVGGDVLARLIAGKFNFSMIEM